MIRRPVSSCRRFLLGSYLVCSALSSTLTAQEPGRRRVGDIYRVETTSTLKGSLLLPSGAADRRTITITGAGRVVYRERILAIDTAARTCRVVRIYDTMQYQRKVADQEQEGRIRDQVRRMIVDYRKGEHMPFSPDGPLEANEVDLIRTHTFVPAIDGMLSPPSAAGSGWNATTDAVCELLGTTSIETGSLRCKAAGAVIENGVARRRITLEGAIVGVSSEGRSRNAVTGELLIDRDSGKWTSLLASGEKQILDASGASAGTVAVEYKMFVVPLESDGDLSDAVVAAMPQTADDSVTALLFEHPGLGIRIRYPRRWQIVNVEGNRVHLEHGGNSVVVHVEPEEKTPSAQAFFDDVRNYLQSKDVAASAVGNVQERENEAGRIGRFRFAAAISGKATVLDYWVVARGRHGATISSRLNRNAIDGLSSDVEFLARHVEFQKPIPTAAATAKQP